MIPFDCSKLVLPTTGKGWVGCFDASVRLLLEELLVLMGGRAAEKTFYDATTNGAAGDLDMARKVALNMIHDWGMGEKLYYEPEKHDAEVEINRLLETADRQALEIIREQLDLEDWMLEQRDELAAHIAKGFAQAERGDLVDGDVAVELLLQRRAERLKPQG